MQRESSRHLTVALVALVVSLAGGNGRNDHRVSLEDVQSMLTKVRKVNVTVKLWMVFTTEVSREVSKLRGRTVN
jgi:hypothetical protein